MLYFSHKGLESFHVCGDSSQIKSSHIEKVRRILLALKNASRPGDMKVPGFGLHKLKGNREEYFSVKVNANWRITFKFSDIDVIDINYEDYH